VFKNPFALPHHSFMCCATHKKFLQRSAKYAKKVILVDYTISPSRAGLDPLNIICWVTLCILLSSACEVASFPFPLLRFPPSFYAISISKRMAKYFSDFRMWWRGGVALVAAGENVQESEKRCGKQRKTKISNT